MAMIEEIRKIVAFLVTNQVSGFIGHCYAATWAFSFPFSYLQDNSTFMRVLTFAKCGIA